MDENKKNFDRPTDRILEYDIAKGIGILLVVVGHSMAADSYIKYSIYSFHMALFFIISVYLMDFSQKVGLTRAIKKEKKLIGDYIFYSFLYIVFDALFRILWTKELYPKAIIGDIYQTITLSGMSVLWFISTLFVCKIIMRMIIPLVHKNVILLMIGMGSYLSGCILAYIIPRGEHGLIMLIFYPAVVITRIIFVFGIMILAYLFKSVFQKLVFTKRSFLLFLADAVCVLTVFIICRMEKRNGIEIVDLKYAKIGNPVITLFLSFFGTFGILSTSHLMRVFDKLCAIFTFFGKNSLFIMVTHEYLMIKDILAWLLVFLFPEVPDNIKRGIILIALILIEALLIKWVCPWGKKVDSFIKK